MRTSHGGSVSEREGTVGKITMMDALKTVIGICRFYCVLHFIPTDIDEIAVYNAANDDFHFFKWDCELGHYIFCRVAENIPNWVERKIAI